MTNEDVLGWLSEVTDPEVPVLSILDLGIVRKVEITEVPGGPSVLVAITPTYSGCPAMDVIAIGIRMALTGHGITNIIIEPQLKPAWTTDWLSEAGRRKLTDYGIAPPVRAAGRRALFGEEHPACPRCGSGSTELISAFGSTACKALHRCLACREPFDAFKCH